MYYCQISADELMRKSNMNKYAVLFLIICFSVLIKIVFCNGIEPTDDLEYIQAAHDMFFKHDNLLVLESLRPGMIAPLAVIIKIFGLHERAFSGFFILISIINIMLAFFIGKLLANERLGILAAFFMAVIPLEISMASRALPDSLIQMFNGTAMMLLLLFLKSDKASHKKIVALLCGISIGMAYLVKESGLFMILPVVIILVYESEKPWKYIFFLVCGVMLMFACDLLWAKIIWGDFFARWHMQKELVPFLEGSLANYYKMNNGMFYIIKRFFLEYPSLLFNPVISPWGILYLLALVLGLVMWFNKKMSIQLARPTRLLFIWWISIFAILNFAVIKIYPHIIPMMMVTPRYALPLDISMCLIVAVFFQSLANGRNSIKMIALILLVFCIQMLYLLRSSAGQPNLSQGYYYTAKTVAKYIVNNYTENRTVYTTDGRSEMMLDFYSQYNEKIKKIPYSDMQKNPPKKGDWIFYYPFARQGVSWTLVHHSDMFRTVPENWTVLLKVEKSFNIGTTIINKIRGLLGVRPIDNNLYSVLFEVR
jgi:4-amino-4-deoxy-L-arabinose transferase-like glycosyltransferase